MIKMQDYEYIRIAYSRYGHSIRKISRDTGISRPAIRKVIDGQEPKYKLTKQKDKPVLGEYTEIIKDWLIKDKQAHPKQRHTAIRIYNRLVEEHGFKGGESTVRGYVKELKEELFLTNKEVFIPSDPEKREGAEVDWGRAKIILSGKEIDCYMFCMRAKYSGKIFVKLYPVEIQECFFNGHIEAFLYFSGVFSEIVYDNLATAVKKVLKGKDRIEQSAFTSFRAYYCFSSIFCNVNSGHEKGGVEGLVKFARKNFLTPIPKCESFDEINASLLEKCYMRDLATTYGQKQQIGELFLKEKYSLLPLPTKPYSNYKLLVDVKIDKYLTLQVKTNRYSVPHKYAGKKVNVELGLSDLRIIYKNKVIATHQRTFEKKKWVLNPWHYMEVLKKKSKAFKSSRILTVIEQDWNPIVKRLWEIQVANHGEIDGTKDFIESLLFFQDKIFEDMLTVIELAIENKTTNKESVKMLYEMLTEERRPIEKAKVDHLVNICHFTLPTPDVNKFDTLLEVTNG